LPKPPVAPHTTGVTLDRYCCIDENGNAANGLNPNIYAPIKKKNPLLTADAVL
jgi:hypothetical protein